MTHAEQTQHGREELSSVLRSLRAQAGLAGREVAARVRFSQSKLSKIENGLLMPSEADARALVRAYRATSTQQRQVLALVRQLHAEVDSARAILQRGAYRKQQQITAVEAQATLYRAFQPNYVLGSLQTRAYIRRVFANLPTDDAEKATEARLQRHQAIFHQSKRFDFIMTEAALRWRVLPDDEMTAQLDHIVDLTSLSNVKIGIIEWTAPVAVFPANAFHIYDDQLAIVGTSSATATIRDDADIQLYLDLFERLRSAASYDDGARHALQRIRRDYRQ